MRWHVRILLLFTICTVAALVWSCTRTDRPNELAQPTTVTSPNFGLADLEPTDCATSLGDRVWVDLDCDGLQDKEEPNAPGIEVNLVNCDTGAIVATTTTDGAGGYVFTNFPAGRYKLCFTLPEGLEWSPKDVGTNDGLDSDVGADGCTDCFNVECDKPLRVRDAGLCGGAGCRVTGGGVNEFGEWDGSTVVGRCSNERYTFGGQAGANTALPVQPAGEWEHNNHSGPSGSFAFHGGTHSAPDGTEIDRIECSDPGFCDPARPAPAHQIDFWGVGMFHNAKNLSAILAANVVVGETLHWFEVNIDDGGEPGRGKGHLNSCPSDGFGLNGSVALVDCDCPDFYRITIHATTDPASAVIYRVWGYPIGGNLQIHPLTGFDSH